MTQTDLSNLLSCRPLGLVFDIDGTLSPIAPTPGEARLYPGIADLLQRAAQLVDVAVMTGRAIRSGAAIVRLENLTYIGTHGLEWADGLPDHNQVHVVPEALPYSEPGKRLLDLVAQEMDKQAGILIEHKIVGGAIHYRLAPNPEQARQRILTLLEEPAKREQMLLKEGKRMVEIVAPLTINKGEALRRYCERFHLQGVLFAGDDLTDLDAILETKRLRSPSLAALSVAVRHHDTLPALLENADIVVEEVEGMFGLLQEIVAQLESVTN